MNQANRPERCVSGHGGHPWDSETCSMREMIYEQLTVKANDDISSTEPALPGARAQILRTASELGLGAMEQLEVYFGNALGGGFGMTPSAGAMAWIKRGRLGGFQLDLEIFFSSLYFSSYWISAWYKWHRNGFLPPATGGGVFPCTRSAQRSPLSGTNWLRDLWSHTRVYELRSSFFLLFIYAAAQKVCR